MKESIDTPVVDPEAIDRILAVLDRVERGEFLHKACKEVGTRPRTFARWLHQNPANRARYEAIIKGQVIEVENALYQRALLGDVFAIKFFLNHRDPARYPNESKIVHAGDPKAPIKMIDLAAIARDPKAFEALLTIESAIGQTSDAEDLSDL